MGQREFVKRQGNKKREAGEWAQHTINVSTKLYKLKKIRSAKHCRIPPKDNSNDFTKWINPPNFEVIYGMIKEAVYLNF